MTDYQKRLMSMVNAMPRAITFPYGQEAFGLTTYSAIPKHGAANRKSAEAYRSFLAGRSFAHRLEVLVRQGDVTATEKVWWQNEH